jgi:hypothetical protein
VNWGDGSSSTPPDRASAGSLGTVSHAYGDNGTYTVTVKVTDKDNGFGSATFSVSVDNVAPTASNPLFVFDPVVGTATARFDYSDAGWLDTHLQSFFTWSIDGGSTRVATITGADSTPPDATGNASDTRKLDPGCYSGLTITGTAKDDDGATSAPLAIPVSSSTTVYGKTFKPPIIDNERNIAKYGNVVPVKVVLTNPCTDATVTDPVLYITLAEGVLDDAVEGDNIVVESVSAADTGQRMRIVDGFYMYNLSTRSLKANTNYTIRIRLNSTTGPVIMQAVLYPKK